MMKRIKLFTLNFDHSVKSSSMDRQHEVARHLRKQPYAQFITEHKLEMEFHHAVDYARYYDMEAVFLKLTEQQMTLFLLKYSDCLGRDYLYQS